MDITNNGVIKDAREVFEETELSKFGALVDQRNVLKAYIKQMEDELKPIDEQLLRLMAGQDCTKVRHDKYNVSIVTKENKRLDREKLIMNGVSASVIEASTVVTESSYLMVREGK